MQQRIWSTYKRIDRYRESHLPIDIKENLIVEALRELYEFLEGR